MEREACLLEWTRDVVLNPVQAGRVSDVWAWAWSRYPAMAGQTPAPPWLGTDGVLGQLGGDRSPVRACYAAFVAEVIGQPRVRAGLCHQVLLGTEGFVARFAEATQSPAHGREVLREQRRSPAQSLTPFERTHAGRREVSRNGVRPLELIAAEKRLDQREPFELAPRPVKIGGIDHVFLREFEG